MCVTKMNSKISSFCSLCKIIALEIEIQIGRVLEEISKCNTLQIIVGTERQ